MFHRAGAPLAVTLIAAVLDSIVGISVTSAIAGVPVRPNFVVIMADDLGYGDISCFGDPGYQTPHLDRLAREGLKLTDFHSNGAVCSPTRAALLTGRYQQRADIDGVIFADPKQNRDHGLHPDEVTFAEALGAVGYSTGIFGKWHLGYETQFNPVRQGFDEFRGYVSGNVCYQAHFDRMGIADWWHDDLLTPEEGYSTHLITEHAIEFIKQHREQPFCCYVAHEAVHSPFQGPEDPAVREEGVVGDKNTVSKKEIPRAYAEMAREMDNGIGQIVATLKELKLAEKTLVLFFSDNGGTPNGNNGPLKGYKGSLWEGGHRVPFIAWHPGTIKAGSVSSETAMTMDIMPTLIQLADAAEAVDHPLDGTSLVPVLYENGLLPERTLFWKAGNNWAVRRGSWKLVNMRRGRAQSDGPQLYHLGNDLGESEDVYAKHPELARSLQEEAVTWQADVAQSAMQELVP
ncbi:MAG: sulfatase-like hydrolase/transferase [Planctomycetaceae bacterium]|nr:sulfatase-like hydrolase/transferase [Planctomycetaceae bacterium]